MKDIDAAAQSVDLGAWPDYCASSVRLVGRLSPAGRGNGSTAPRGEDREVTEASGDLAGRSSPRKMAALSRIRLRHLSCFVVVAQERKLARAAARLHLSQ